MTAAALIAHSRLPGGWLLDRAPLPAGTFRGIPHVLLSLRLPGVGTRTKVVPASHPVNCDAPLARGV